MRRLVALVLVALLSSCGGATPARPAGAAAGPVAIVPLSAPGAADPTQTVSVPAGSAEVQFRMAGVDRPAAELTAELESQATGEVRRWPVDDAVPGRDGATLAVTVPSYAVPPGDHVLTLWAGDAEVVRRYAFRLVRP